MRIVFLGDSLTRRFDWGEALPGFDVRNAGFDGDTTAGVLARLSPVIAEKPDLIFLQVGINDYVGLNVWMGEGPPSREAVAEIVQNHRKIWRRLQDALPRTKIHVCSLLPTAFPFDDSGRINEGIRGVNGQLEKAACEAKLPYIDLYPRLADAGGRLAGKFDQDGVHLLPPAYAVWLETLRPFLDSPSLP